MENSNSIAETTFLFRRNIIKKMNSDIRFLGIFCIIYGALTCIGIVTAIIGVPYIIMGIRLRESADHFARYIELGDEMDLNMALEKQQRYYFISKVLVIIALVFLLLYLIFIFVLFSFLNFSDFVS
jgi:hypothetical protein